MPLTNPPFTREKGAPPFHLRPWTAPELEQALRMKQAAEALARNAKTETETETEKETIE
jgi:hypothetical protein